MLAAPQLHTRHINSAQPWHSPAAGLPPQVLATKAWMAYPQFSPPEQYSPFVLAPGLYYNNAIENFASAMEMSAIAARNSALLASQHLAAAQLLGKGSGGAAAEAA
jgi:hypothetical protein